MGESLLPTANLMTFFSDGGITEIMLDHTKWWIVIIQFSNRTSANAGKQTVKYCNFKKRYECSSDEAMKGKKVEFTVSK